MIKKKNLWFLTLFSLILVLSIYYITMPNELLITNNDSIIKNSDVNKNEDNDKKVDIMESDIIRNLAKQEESFVLVGRCGNYILESEGCFRVFIYGNKEERIKRAVEQYGVDSKKAESFLRKIDKRRETFYNTNSGRLWQDKEQYELCLNSSELGDELCAEIIVETFRKFNGLK